MDYTGARQLMTIVGGIKDQIYQIQQQSKQQMSIQKINNNKQFSDIESQIIQLSNQATLIQNQITMLNEKLISQFVQTEEQLRNAIANSDEKNIIVLKNDIVLEQQLVIDKTITLKSYGRNRYKLTTTNQNIIQMIVINAANVIFDSSLVVQHNIQRINTNNNDYVAIQVNGTGFQSQCEIQYEKFGYDLSNSADISGNLYNIGPDSSSKSYAFLITNILTPCTIHDVQWSSTQVTNKMSNFIKVTINTPQTQFIDSTLSVIRCVQLSGFQCRQFIMLEALNKHENATPKLIFQNNVFDAINGDIGIYLTDTNKLNYFTNGIILTGNKAGSVMNGNVVQTINSAYNLGNYKGLLYLTTLNVLSDCGSCDVTLNNNINQNILRHDNDYQTFNGVNPGEFTYSTSISIVTGPNII